MHALRDFFSTDYGLLSAAVIAFRWHGRVLCALLPPAMREDEACARAEGKL